MDYSVIKNAHAPAPESIPDCRRFLPYMAYTLVMTSVCRSRLAVYLLLLMLASGLIKTADAAEAVRPFVSGSLRQILDSRKDKPFILVFWSLECQFCPTELKMMGEFKRRYPKLDVILVATDSPQEISQLSDRARHYGTDKMEQWVFAEDMPERLRFEIDRRWYGEVPRTQFYDRTHRHETKTGLVSQQFLEDWLVRQSVKP